MPTPEEAAAILDKAKQYEQLVTENQLLKEMIAQVSDWNQTSTDGVLSANDVMMKEIRELLGPQAAHGMASLFQEVAQTTTEMSSVDAAVASLTSGLKDGQQARLAAELAQVTTAAHAEAWPQQFGFSEKDTQHAALTTMLLPPPRRGYSNSEQPTYFSAQFDSATLGMNLPTTSVQQPPLPTFVNTANGIGNVVASPLPEEDEFEEDVDVNALIAQISDVPRRRRRGPNVNGSVRAARRRRRAREEAEAAAAAAAAGVETVAQA